MEIRAALPEEREAVRALMKTALGGCRLLAAEPAMMAWKYDQPRPDWAGARSLVAVEGGVVAGHAGLWPLRLGGEGGPVRCVHLIDWAAGRSSAGAGVAVYQAGLEAAPAALVIGGSSQAQRLLPRLGFRRVGEMKIYARPLRIWRQFLDRPGCGPARRAALAARNLLWRLQAGAGPGGRGWALERVERPLPAHVDWFATPGAGGGAGSLHSADSLRYLLACPGARVSLWQAAEAGRPRALILLAVAGPQARVADLRVDQDTPRAWAAAYAAAMAAALEEGAHEIAAGATGAQAGSALAASGFRVRAVKPVWLRGGGGLLAADAPLRLQMADSDGFFVFDAGDPYLT